MSRANSLSRRVCEMVMNCTDKELSLMTVVHAAIQVKVNSSYLSRQFKKETSMGLNAFITGEKMKRIAQLMVDPKRKINLKTLTELNGFSRSDYLSNLFKAQFGISLMNYKIKSKGSGQLSRKVKKEHESTTNQKNGIKMKPGKKSNRGCIL